MKPLPLTSSEKVYIEMIDDYQEYIVWLSEQRNIAYEEFKEYSSRLQKEQKNQELCKQRLRLLQDCSGVTDGLKLIQV